MVGTRWLLRACLGLTTVKKWQNLPRLAVWKLRSAAQPCRALTGAVIRNFCSRVMRFKHVVRAIMAVAVVSMLTGCWMFMPPGGGGHGGGHGGPGMMGGGPGGGHR